MTKNLTRGLAVSSLALACMLAVQAPAISQSTTTDPAADPAAPAATAAEPAVDPARQIAVEPAQPAPDATAEPAAPVAAAPAEPAAPAVEVPADAPAKVAAVSPSDPAPQNSIAAEAAIPAPQSDLGKAAYASLDKHCARCHQDGKLEDRVKPASGFGNVLHLQAMAKDPSLVIPGNPDNSELVKQILSGNMPYDIKDGSNYLAPTPTKEEIAAVRDWIVSLKASGDAACKTREFLSNEHIIETIAKDLDTQPSHRIHGMRYITLANLYNACATDAEMEVYRQAVVKLLNSLSNYSDVLTLNYSVAGPYKTLIRFNVDDLQWTAKTWEQLAAVYPYAVQPDVQKYGYLASTLSTKVPYIRADWFAFAASRPPLYHDLLKMPKTYQALEKHLGVDTLANIKNFLAKRSGFQRSLVSQNNRLIERHAISTGYFWTSYDFAGNKGDQSLFEHPLGPTGKNPFKHDGGETIYSLPNGFQGYYLNAADGKQLDKGPTEIVRDKDRKDLAVTNGISCMGCHDQGIRLAQDDIRPHIVGNRNYSKEVREHVEALYPTHDEMAKILKDDTISFQNAMRKAGLNPALKLGGIEIINALSNKYEKDVHLRLAAAEFGLKPKIFSDAANSVGGDAKSILRRLEQGVVPRDNFEGKFAALVPQLTDDAAIASIASTGAVKEKVIPKPNSGDGKVAGKFKLTLFADKTIYHQHDLPVFIVQSPHACHLTLINVDDKGTGTVIFPNAYQKDTLIKANHAFEFPGPKAPFQFRMKDIGTETVIALCNEKKPQVDAIKHNFKAKQFTDLGNYEKYVTRAIAVEAKAHKPKKKLVKKISNIAKGSGVARAAIKLKVIK